MTTVWRVAPEAADAERVEELARKEYRPVANMVKVLLHEALFARQLAEGKQSARGTDHRRASAPDPRRVDIKTS